MKGPERKFGRMLLAILSLAFLLSGCAPATEARPFSLNLRGPWKILCADSPEYAAPGFDDRGHISREIPGNWNACLEKNRDLTARVWLRKRVNIGRGFRGRPLALILSRVGIADEAYLNGRLVGSNGIIPREGNLLYSLAWQNPRRYIIPESFINFDGDNVIALRVFSHVINGISGTVEIRDTSANPFRDILDSYGSLMISTTSLVLNALFFLGLVILYLTQRSKKEYLFFSLIALLTFLAALLTLETPAPLPGLLRFKGLLSLYALVNLFAFLGVKEFLGEKRPALTYAPLALFLPAGLVIAAAPDTRALIHYGGSAALILGNLYIVGAAVLFFRSVFDDPRRYWYFLFIAVPVPVSVLRNSYYLMTYQYQDLPLVIFIHVPLVFTLYAFYYIYDFERTKRENDDLYRALLRKSQRFQRTLKTIQKTGSKPEPRDMINDVIEYLDGHYMERYSRKELASRFGLNEDYMGQIFRKTAGTNISNYINAKRIDAARDLLLETDAKIIDIAYHVGFDNLTHFHRQFKRQTNLTPNEYRQMMRDGDQT